MVQKSKNNAFELNKTEIFYNLINAALAGGLVFLGALTSGNLTWTGVVAALIASLIVIAAKFKEYWSSQESEYTPKIFNFIH